MTQFDKTFNLMKNYWAIAGLLILVVLSYLFADRLLAQYFHQINIRTNWHWLYIVTNFGKWKLYVVIFLGAGLFFRFIRKHPDYEKKAWFLLSCIVGANLFNGVLKVVLGRARPDLLFSSNEYGLYWLQFTDLYWSMPSGHAVTITALACGLGVLVPRYFLVFICVALAVIASRVLLTCHYLSDVLLSIYVAVLIVGIIATYFRSKHWLKTVK